MLPIYAGGNLCNFAGQPIVLENLIWFEGVILSLCRVEETNEKFLFLWVDKDWEHNRYMVIPVTDEVINKYKGKEISLRDIILQTAEVKFMDFGDDPIFGSKIFSLPTNKIPEDIMPDDDSFFDESFSI